MRRDLTVGQPQFFDFILFIEGVCCDNLIWLITIEEVLDNLNFLIIIEESQAQ